MGTKILTYCRNQREVARIDQVSLKKDSGREMLKVSGKCMASLNYGMCYEGMACDK